MTRQLLLANFIFMVVSTQLVSVFICNPIDREDGVDADGIPEMDGRALIETHQKSLIESRSIALEANSLFDFDSDSDLNSDLKTMESRGSSSVVISSLLGSSTEGNDLIRNLVQRESRSDFVVNGCHCKIKEHVTTKRFFRSGRQKKLKLSCKCSEDGQSDVPVSAMITPSGQDSSSRSNSGKISSLMSTGEVVVPKSGSTHTPAPDQMSTGQSSDLNTSNFMVQTYFN